MSNQSAKKTDLAIWDSTPSGLIAAVAAARSGLQVLVITQDEHLGGMQSSGLGNTNAGRRETVGGLAREFYRRVFSRYERLYGPGSAQAVDSQQGFHFEPHIAEEVYEQWLGEVGVECWKRELLQSVDREGSRIRAVRLRSGTTVAAKCFLDASYEGDLFKLAGCSYHLGREGRKQYGETLAGARFPLSEIGREDRSIQGYDYRLCLTDNPANRVPIAQPANYNPNHYAFRRAKFTLEPPTRLSQVLPINLMPNRKTDSRTGEWTGGSWDYPEADFDERKRIDEAHRRYSEGYLWFALTDPSIPSSIRDELSEWGLARDEFKDNGNWPYHLYVREARRLRGEYVMTQRDVTEDRFKPDSVALGSFFMDVHPVRMLRVTVSDLLHCDPLAQGSGEGSNLCGIIAEGNIGNVRVQPYEVPYRALLPRRTEAENLLVSVCVSASHVAYSTIRMEPVYQMLGHAAGKAAALCLASGKRLHELNVSSLRDSLLEESQILDARSFIK